jgi:hypothetical protein
VVWSYLSHCGMNDRPPKRWAGYDALSKLLSNMNLGAMSSSAIGKFVERCYTETAYKHKGKTLRRIAFASAIAAKLKEYKSKFIHFGIKLIRLVARASF